MRTFLFTNFLDPNRPQTEVEIREGRSVEKVLTGRDVDNGQLIMPKGEFKEYILSQLPPEKQNAIEDRKHVPIKVKDLHTSTTKELTLWKNSAGSYVLNNGWMEFFVRPKSLVAGEKVGLCWDHEEAELLLTVISRAE